MLIPVNDHRETLQVAQRQYQLPFLVGQIHRFRPQSANFVPPLSSKKRQLRDRTLDPLGAHRLPSEERPGQGGLTCEASELECARRIFRVR